jgi:hypothetical protein
MERFLVSRNDEEMLMQFIDITKNELSFMALGVSVLVEWERKRVEEGGVRWIRGSAG